MSGRLPRSANQTSQSVSSQGRLGDILLLERGVVKRGDGGGVGVAIWRNLTPAGLVLQCSVVVVIRRTQAVHAEYVTHFRYVPLLNTADLSDLNSV
ncbi:hypothetical protein J6590_038754 [Homalodisca vitripennis]|nr:hypothetical protein J6590_038754 [Homalodisca vitripennis]